jgi:organic hydroperoxide reductase OsmC/OhrA
MSASVTIAQQSGYRFNNVFADSMPPLVTDLSAPLGGGQGPSPEHLLAAAVANCLSSSLLFSLGKFKQDPSPITTTATAIEGRNERNRLRVQRLEVKITLGRAASELRELERVLGSFEDYCTVTASVRAAIPVEVQVFDAKGARLK